MKSLLDDIYSDKEVEVTKSVRKAIQKAIKNLPQEQQSLIHLYYDLAVPAKEIAIKSKCSVSSIYSKLNKSLFVLKSEFNPKSFEKAYQILYPETGKPMTIVSSNVSEYVLENNQSVV